MLLVQCSPAGGLKLTVERRKGGLLFRWGKSFEIYLTFTGRVKWIDVNDVFRTAALLVETLRFSAERP